MPISKFDLKIIQTICEQEHISKVNGWKNFSQNIDLPEALLLDVEDVASLQALMKTIHQLNQDKNPEERIILRVAAGGDANKLEYSESYSITALNDADVVIRLVGDEFRYIKKTQDKNIVEVGGSMQIGDVDRELYDNYNLALPTASLIPYVTVAGLSATAGHGTGKDQPGFCGLIRAMTICLPNGRIIRIDDKDPSFEVIRGAHLGVFGVVLSVEMQCVKAKKMQCITEVRSIPEFLEEVKSGLFMNDPYVSVMYVPTYQPDERDSTKIKNVIVYRWRPVDKSNLNVNNHPAVTHVGQELGIYFNEKLNVANLMREYPHLIPYFTKYVVTKAAVGINDGISVGPWYSVHYQTAFPRDIDDADYLFEVSKDCNQICTAMEKIVDVLTQFSTLSSQYPITNAVYLRLFNGTNGGLSTSAHRDGHYVCGLDMVSSEGIDGYDKFKRTMQEYFINGKLAAKPHWGKYVPSDMDIAALYGEQYKEFIRILHSWYKDHGIRIESSMLLNSFICDRLNLPYAPESRINYSPRAIQRAGSSSQEIANAVIEKLDKNNEYGEVLSRRLHTISSQSVSEKKSSFYQSAKNKSDKIVIERKSTEHTDRCCVIL